MISKLSPEVVAAIAAGEVIERPASALKELVENSLDAGATRIVVELVGGGLDLIAVTDDGCGIPSDQIELAFQRHTTSKIGCLGDLRRITTFGFRGEALASIASSAARIVVTSLCRGEFSGTRLVIENGRVVERAAAGCPLGTRIEVHGLFRLVPARLKFLKEARREGVLAQRALIDLALGNPGVSHKLIVDGEVAFATEGGDLLSTYQAIFGEEPDLFPVADGFVSGLLSLNSDWPSRTRQFLYVNHRAVSCQNMRRTVEAAYRSLQQVGRYPRFVLDLQLDPATIDVNVHPTKAEVRFADEEALRKAVFASVRNSLAQRQYSGLALVHDDRVAYQPEGEHIPTQQRLLIETVKREFPAGESRKEFGVLGTAYSRYLLVESPQAIYLIDQHAAHERVLYETLLRAASTSGQLLVEPLCITLPPASDLDAAAVCGLLADMGFRAEVFGKRDVLIREVPELKWTSRAANWGEILREVLAEGKPLELKAMAAAIAACHASVRTGDRLTPQEAESLVLRLFQCNEPYRCPHGRPTMITISRELLDERFGRNG